MAILEEDEYGLDEFKERDEEIEEEDVESGENDEPFVGMEFANEIEAKKFYNSYGGRLGFSVRVQTSGITKVGISSIRMVCSKQGLSNRQKQANNMGTPQKEIPNTRSGCMAFIRFRRYKNGVWKVSKFNAVHNHVLIANHTSIYRFVLQLEKLVEGIWQRESDEDCRTINETPQLWSLNGMEVDAREVYTKKIFSLFKKRFKDSSNGIVVEVEQKRCYEVNITKHPSFPNWVPEIHKVCIDMADVTVLCSCKGFEFSGLLCAHAMKVMQHVGIEHLPYKYILKRWTKGANESVKRSIRERSTSMEESTELQSMRHATLYPKVVQLVHLATKSIEAFRCADVSLDELKDKILTLIPSKWSAPEEVIEQQTLIPLPAEEYIDPPMSQCKGRKKKPQRIKPILEKIVPKRRTCSYCNEKGGHNFRSCPKRKQDIANGKRKQDENDDT